MALGDHDSSISIRGRLITSVRFADDIVVNAEEEEEAGVLIDRHNITTTRQNGDKMNVMTHNPNGFQREIKIKGQRQQWRTSSTLEQSSLTKDQNLRFFSR